MLEKHYQIHASLNQSKLVTSKNADGNEVVMDSITKKYQTPLELALSGLAGCEINAFRHYGKLEFGLELEHIEIKINAYRSAKPKEDYYIGLRVIEFEWIIKSNKTKAELQEIIRYVHSVCPVYNTFSGRIKYLEKITVL